MQKSNWDSRPLDEIKRGLKASFVSYEERRSGHGLKIIKDGVKKYFPLVGHPGSVTTKGYKELFETLKDFNFDTDEYVY